MSLRFKDPHVILDLETTGLSPKLNRIIEIAIIDLSCDTPEEWSSLVKPNVPIPSEITRITRIDDNTVKKSPVFSSIAETVLERLKGKVIIAHNAKFDYGFLKEEFARAGVAYESRTLCTLELSRQLYSQHKSHSLGSIIERNGFQLESRHRALDDARAVWHFLKAVQKDYPDLTDY
jgi:DNA polymerase-3 subunit epsilon